MHLIQEELARAQIRERVEMAHQRRRVAHFQRLRRLARKADRAAEQETTRLASQRLW